MTYIAMVRVAAIAAVIAGSSPTSSRRSRNLRVSRGFCCNRATFPSRDARWYRCASSALGRVISRTQPSR